MTAKEAAQKAFKYLVELYGEESVKGVRLEEIEKEFDADIWFWIITLSFIDDPYAVLVDKVVKSFKIFKIRDKDGEIESMKIRDISTGK